MANLCIVFGWGGGGLVFKKPLAPSPCFRPNPAIEWNIPVLFYIFVVVVRRVGRICSMRATNFSIFEHMTLYYSKIICATYQKPHIGTLNSNIELIFITV